MACPFDNDPVDEGAALLRRELNIRRERVVRLRIDVAFPNNYHFQTIIFLSGTVPRHSPSFTYTT